MLDTYGTIVSQKIIKIKGFIYVFIYFTKGKEKYFSELSKNY